MPADLAALDLHVLALAPRGAVLRHPLRPDSTPTRTGRRHPFHNSCAAWPHPREYGADLRGAARERALTRNAALEQRAVTVSPGQHAHITRLKRLTQQPCG